MFCTVLWNMCFNKKKYLLGCQNSNEPDDIILILSKNMKFNDVVWIHQQNKDIK